MPLIVDFVLPRRPLSHQAKNSTHKRAWNEYVFGRALLAWPARPLINHALNSLRPKLAQAVAIGQACVYVAISDSSELAEELK